MKSLTELLIKLGGTSSSGTGGADSGRSLPSAGSARMSEALVVAATIAEWQ